MEKISVIIPIYNVENYLKRCIDSVINQTYKNLEIILVDDGSKDNCGKICDEYAKVDSRIQVIHKINGGLSDARNAGLKVATGDYIYYIDSDDYIDNDMLEIMKKNLEKYNADISICGIYKECENGNYTLKRNNVIEIMNSKEALIKLNSFSSFDMAVWNKLYKKYIVDGIEFPFGKKSEDYFVMYQYFDRASNIVVIPESKYHYIQRENSISRGKNITHDYIEGSLRQKEFITAKYPDISYVGNTAYAFSYIATYNRYIKNNVKLSNENIKLFRSEVRNYLKDILKNNYIASTKKLQAIVFSINLNLYSLLIKVIK